jgi:branched-chain amino acid transport system substrate-binding protein
MKRRISIALLFVLVMGMLAACGGAATPSGTASTAAPAAPAATTAPAEPAATTAPAETAAPAGGEATAAPAGGAATGEKPDDPLGVVEIASGDPIVLAYALVTSGENSTLGEDARRGVEIAVEDMKAELLGHPIELTGEDTLCSAEGGQAAATKLASNAQIVAIVGTSCSSEARVLAPVIDKAGMVMVSPSNTAPDLTEPATHVKGYLRTAHNDKVQGRVAAEFAFNSLGLKKAATIHDGSPYAQGLVTVFGEVFKELGGEVVAAEAVNVGDTDMRPVLTRIATLSPEILYYPIFVAEGGFITRQAKEVSGLENAKLMGSDGIFSPKFIEAAGESAKDMYLTSPDFSAFTGGYAQFLEKHKAKYNENPLSAFHAHAYDATNMIAAAIQKVAVQGADGTLWIPRQALRDALYATKDFQGLTGSLTCDPNGDCADPKIAAYQVIDPDAANWNPGAAADSNPKKIYP